MGAIESQWRRFTAEDVPQRGPVSQQRGGRRRRERGGGAAVNRSASSNLAGCGPDVVQSNSVDSWKTRNGWNHSKKRKPWAML